jgi:hypothetical protein
MTVIAQTLPRLLAVAAAALVSCTRPVDPALVSGRASVQAGCPVLLAIEGIRYEPEGLPDSLAVVGLELHIIGRTVSRPSTCMMGQGLIVMSASRAP